MKNSRVTRSTNIGNPRAISNSIHGTTLSANLPKKEKLSTSNSKIKRR